MKNKRALVLAGTIALLAACAPAPIAISPGLAAASERIAIVGMGYGERGSFALAQSSGSFDRRAHNTKSSVPFSSADISRSFGGGRLTVGGADFNGQVEVNCRYAEGEIGSDRLSVTVAPFHYRCGFLRDGAPIAAEFVLQAAPRRVGPLTGETRAGFIRLGDRTIGIEPIHHSPSLKVATGEPLGYRFVLDGEELGAVDLNGGNKMIFVASGSPHRETILIASLALSLLWAA